MSNAWCSGNYTTWMISVIIFHKMPHRRLSLAAIILATLSIFKSQSQFTIKTEQNKAFGESCRIGKTLKIISGKIANCLEHCLNNCRCQSFQICNKTKCELCSSHKEENSSLLHDKDDCVYATYEAQNSTKRLQELGEQCSDKSCLMKYNCCQQSGLCRKNEICKPINSLEKPWKRFTCECPDGYHGDDCDQRITSCQGYANGSRISGMYKVVDFGLNLVYEVFCYFDSDGAWSLVQSFSLGNFAQFNKPLSVDLSIGERNALAWNSYRLGKARMLSIEKSSLLLRFTCNHHAKTRNVNESDYLQLLLEDVGENVLELKDYSSRLPIQHGIIGQMKLQKDGCSFQLNQNFGCTLHAATYLSACGISPTPNATHCNTLSFYSVFGDYHKNNACFVKTHGCTQHVDSTTQLWFGH